jgi:hypothetical protein
MEGKVTLTLYHIARSFAHDRSDEPFGYVGIALTTV